MRTFEKKMCGKKMCGKKGAGRTMINKKNRVRWCCKHMMILWLMVVCLGGCKVVEEESPKIRDLEYVLVGEELIPEQLKSILEEKKAARKEIAEKEALRPKAKRGRPKKSAPSPSGNQS